MYIHTNLIKKKVWLFTAVLFCVGALFNSAYAKIQITVDRTYTITSENEMLVEEVHNIFNGTENLFIPAGEELEFEILGFKNNDPKEIEILETAVNTAVLKRNNTPISFQHKYGPNKVTIQTKYPSNFYPGAQLQYILTYNHPGLIYENGALSEAYIHAFGENFKFELTNTSYTFNTKLLIPKSIEDNYFMFPDPTNSAQDNNNLIFEYDQTKLINQYVYIQLGRKQIYEFELIQEVEPTESQHTGLKNRYEIIIPRNFKNGIIEQNIFIEAINPEPISIKLDEEGNVVGTFDFFTDEKSHITVKGYGALEVSPKEFKAKVGEISDIPRELVSKYTQPAEFWEVDNPQIIKTADSIPAYENNVYELTESMYKYVVDSIDYSQVKKFGLNERQGALATLNGGAAVCMEYADLFLTLMRAREIPTRAVFGYGYDPQRGKDQQEAHQWVQVYMPGLDYNWVDVDVTWGEGGTTLIGGDLNHFYTHFAYKDPNTPNVISRNSFGNKVVDNLTAPKINITAVAALPDSNLIVSIDDVIEKYKTDGNIDIGYTIRQFMNRYRAGFTGLIEEPNLNNSSQLITLSSILLFFVIFFYVLAPIYTYRHKK